ncbi:MAG TPA: hypothetical protein VM142_10170 [Acidimicrobiales bacterium]|nr:hypothetical protein [Acidimicrobiales bacterium]
MKGTKRGAGLVAAAAAVLILGAASMAWACTTQAYVGRIDPGSGAPGSRATVTASQFNPGPVEIRWNGTGGRLLATANGPDFSVEITIPPATPNTYSVVAVQRSGSVILGKAAVPFEVTPASAAESGGYQSGSSGDTSSTGQTASARTAGGSGSTGTSGSDAGTAPASSGTVGNGGAAFPGEPGGNGSAAVPGEPDSVGAPAAASGATGRRADAVPAAASSAVASSRGANAASVPAASGLSAPQPDSPSAAPVRDDDRIPVSKATAAGDLWSGFDGSAATVGPSLVDAPGSNPGVSPQAVAGLFSAALVALFALFAGFALAEAGRRRAAVVSTSRQG